MSNRAQSGLDNGLSIGAIAKSVQRAYAACMWEIKSLNDPEGRAELDALELTDGWIGIAEFAVNTFLACGETDQQLTVRDWADQVYRSYASDLPPYADLPNRERLAWEAVARHAAMLMHADEEDLLDLAGLEVDWGNWIGTNARQRGIELEPVAS